jgi:uncharacterized cupin superfamily protein
MVPTGAPQACGRAAATESPPMAEPTSSPPAVHALDIPEPALQTRYPEPFASWVRGRTKRRLGDHFGLETFGVNLVRMAPGSVSSVRHHHSGEDEFVYVLAGTPTLVLDHGEQLLSPGMCAGFKAGSGHSHQLANRSDAEVVFLEVGTRQDVDTVLYPYDDLAIHDDGKTWAFVHKDGRAFE